MATLTTEQAAKKFPEIAEELFQYADHVVADYKAWNASSASHQIVSSPEKAEWLKEYHAEKEAEFAMRLAWNVGREYIKLVKGEGEGTMGTSVHSFIVVSKNNKFGFQFGDILKSASWKKPATNYSRGNLLNGTESYADNVHWTGAL